ncbi:beta-N-acetylhexosaminidase [Paenibacillus physcomitrellae]|uniref:Beta-N-acetylhexosaminidase n=1 Tax=Paenibacillus physcomitrellae TaxID=1619311 RepID=A0ABQ1FK47_9BACL|nr:glycoside hydrolase family 20 protein [Paenibacillus physcomitrellae]GGA19587.1 hypothetical protein GCM10010917_00250 [Paenibacillus physcomitrellae]
MEQHKTSKERNLSAPAFFARPSVQQFTQQSDEQWRVSGESKIIIIENANSSGNPVLADMVSLVQSEFAARQLPNEDRIGRIPVQTGTISAAGAGDLVVELMDLEFLRNHIQSLGRGEHNAPSASQGSEAYTLEIGSFVHLKSATERGLLYAFRTLLQQLLAQGCLAYGTVVDYPAVQERALHVDIGRKFFSKDWILNRIKELSWLKLNVLQLHFSENEGFTLQCDSHPEVMSPQYLTKEDLEEILQTAKRYHVTVIPSLDSPGHLGYALKDHPEWLLQDSSGAPAKGALDITNEEAKRFVLDLIDEYAELFQESPYFHIGGDEFIDFEQFALYPQLEKYAQEKLGIQEGQGVDTYIDYINQIAVHLEEKGFIVRAWNDGLYRQDQTQRVHPKASIQITYWTKWHRNMATAQTFLDLGYELINYNDAYFYYVLGENAGYKYPTGDKIYEDWHPGLLPKISDTEKQEYPVPYPSSLIGCSFAIWSDTPDAQTEQQVAEGIYEPLRAMAEKAWIAEKRYGSYEAFKRMTSSIE